MPKLLAPAGLPDTSIGSISAPVTLIEYSSPTCSHCVEYRTRVAPRIHAEFVTTGKVRSIFRPFVRHNVDLVIFMLGRMARRNEARRGHCEFLPWRHVIR
ncbi:thioredoxin domain-containing protein [Sinorhizobium meliloti]|uniref:thioredoxin domain-containing protein n=1 Tax=Rhizobium meliloti TaxID=382 RepID=UPI001F201FD4|nr:thioredoxin domain-containing protein [Sinorhizobium meliloti]